MILCMFGLHIWKTMIGVWSDGYYYKKDVCERCGKTSFTKTVFRGR